MAEIWASRLMLQDWDIRSAAWNQPSFNDIPIEVLKEIIMEIPPVEQRLYNAEEVQQADLIIALHDAEFEQADIPGDLPMQKLVRWDIPNPEIRSTDKDEKWALYQEVCDAIAMNIKQMEPILRSQPTQ
ncbi:phosphatase [Planococcus maritimus]|nr:phosphatase [Planococcus maritimus]